MDAAQEGTGGIAFGEANKCIPTVFRLKWPPKVQALVLDLFYDLQKFLSQLSLYTLNVTHLLGVITPSLLNRIQTVARKALFTAIGCKLWASDPSSSGFHSPSGGPILDRPVSCHATDISIVSQLTLSSLLYH